MADDDASLRLTKHAPGYKVLEDHFGARHQDLVWWRFATVLAVPWALLATAWAVYETKTDPKVETVFVLVDEETRVLHTAQARAWTFDEQAKADIARNWVFDLRNRSPDNYAAAIYRQQARRYTGDGTPAVDKANTMLNEMDEKLGKLRDDGTKVGLATRDLIAAPVGHDEETNSTVVRVEWQERTYDDKNHTGPWQSMHMYIHVQAIEPTDTQQIMANGHGLYVVDISALGKGRAPAAVAAAQ